MEVSGRARRRRRRISRKWELRIKISAVALCLIAGGVCLARYIGLTKVDFNRLSTVKVTGYDSKGTATVVIAEEEKLTEAQLQESPELDEFLSTVEVRVSKTENLSNGETINIQYLYDEGLAKESGILVTDDSKTVIVANLPQPEVITNERLFQEVKVIYQGISPMVTATLVNESSHPYLQNIRYEIRDPKEYYRKGDIITVDAFFDEEDAVLNQYEIQPGEEGYTCRYVVEGVDSYLSDASLITDGMLEEMIERGTSCFKDANQYGLRLFSEANRMPIWRNRKTTFEWRDPYFISAYFTTITKEAMGSAGTHMNDVKIVYGVTLTQADGVSCGAEIVVRYSDLIERPDGSIDLALDSVTMISASHDDSLIKELVRNEHNDNYISEKIR